MRFSGAYLAGGKNSKMVGYLQKEPLFLASSWAVERGEAGGVEGEAQAEGEAAGGKHEEKEKQMNR